MSAERSVFFDASVLAMVATIRKELGDEALASGLLVRDTSGRLRFLSPNPSPALDVRTQLESKLLHALGGYAKQDRLIAFRDEPGVQFLLSDVTAFPMQEGGVRYRLLDKRIVGSSWVDPPEPESGKPPRMVFASIKGGVGRSTALALTAADLARRNKNVLAVDLDLEAPGLGDLLLDDERTPEFGTVDYLVENGISGVHDGRLSDFVGTSPLTTGGGGRVDVLPALGRQAIGQPGNTLAKISRAMIEDIDADGNSISLAAQIGEMIRRFAARSSYDAVLIDSRAGLSELAAPTILGLGAHVLLFGTAQRQTSRDYGALFGTLKLLAERDRGNGGCAEWRLLFKAVHAKSSLGDKAAARYRDELYELFAENLYDAEELDQADAIAFDIDDRDAPHWPLTIPFTQSLLDFDPLARPGEFSADFYEQWYRPFLNGVDSLLASHGSAGEAAENGDE